MHNSTSSKLALITTVYQNYSILSDFFASVEQQTNKNFGLYLTDLSYDKKTISQNDSTVILHTENKGYAHGVNTGLQHAIKDGYVQFCVINSDVVLDKNFIENVLKSLGEHPGSLIGGKIYYAKGFEFHHDRYKSKDLGKVLWYAGGINDWNNSWTKHRGVDEVDKKQYNNFESTDFITGCLVAFDKTVVDRIGLWDEEYFLYYEDADYSERAKRDKIPLYYDPSIVMWHKNAQSTSGSGSIIHQKYQRESQLRFGLKYAPLKTKLHLLKNYVSSSMLQTQDSPEKKLE